MRGSKENYKDESKGKNNEIKDYKWHRMKKRNHINLRI